MTLRYGILCNDTTLYAWEALCLDFLEAVEGVQLAAVIVNDAHESRPTSAGFLHKLWKFVGTDEGAWTAYRRYFVNRRSKAMRRVDLRERWAGIPTQHCRPVREGKFSEYFAPDDLDALRSLDLDFMIRFGFGILRGEVLQVPKYGVWSFHHDDLDVYRGQPPCFWEIYFGDPVTGAVLQRLTDRLDAGVVLKRGYFKTDDTSYALNREKVYFGSVEWPAHVCRDLLNGRADYLKAPPSATKAPLYVLPTRRQLAHFLLRTTWNYTKALTSPLIYTDRWNVGWVENGVHELIEENQLPAVRWAPVQKTPVFVADPHPFDGSRVLVEEFDFRTNKGHIAVFDAVGPTFSRLGVALNGGTHLSYPFVFRQGDRHFCLPEAAGSGRLVLYESAGGPTEWRPVDVLIDEPILDPTLLEHEGRWWLFGTLEGHYPDTMLYLWHADRPAGPWRRHATNPVKCDVRSSRPAGALFRHEGRLYRPAQDCSHTYGGAVAINRVERLSTLEFREETVTTIRPSSDSPYPHGTHTLAGWGARTLVDGKRRVFVPRASLRYLDRKLSRKSNKQSF